MTDIDINKIPRSSLCLDDCIDLDYFDVGQVTAKDAHLILERGLTRIPRSVISMMDNNIVWIAYWWAEKEDLT